MTMIIKVLFIVQPPCNVDDVMWLLPFMPVADMV